MGNAKKNKSKFLRKVPKRKSKLTGTLISLLCIIVFVLGILAFWVVDRDGKPPIHGSVEGTNNPTKETLDSNTNETYSQEETESTGTSNVPEDQVAMGDTDQDEASIIDAYVNDELHLIYIMSDGTEVDAGVMNSDSTIVPEYTVTFMDYNATIIKTETVKKGEDAVSPTMPSRTGYTFVGWNGSYANISADVTLIAQYQQQVTDVTTYVVDFLDHNGNVLKTEVVEEGKNASAPAEPNRDGYIFTGWDKKFDKVTSELTVTAQYDPIINPMIVIDTVETTSGQSGIAVRIAVKNNPGISSMKLVVSYDEKLVLEKVSYDVVGGITQAPQKLDSPVILNWANPMENATGDWTFATLTFKVSKDASGELPIKVRYDVDDVYDMSEANIYFEVINGAIIVK